MKTKSFYAAKEMVLNEEASHRTEGNIFQLYIRQRMSNQKIQGTKKTNKLKENKQPIQKQLMELNRVLKRRATNDQEILPKVFIIFNDWRNEDENYFKIPSYPIRMAKHQEHKLQQILVWMWGKGNLVHSWQK